MDVTFDSIYSPIRCLAIIKCHQTTEIVLIGIKSRIWTKSHGQVMRILNQYDLDTTQNIYIRNLLKLFEMHPKPEKNFVLKSEKKIRRFPPSIALFLIQTLYCSIIIICCVCERQTRRKSPIIIFIKELPYS